MTRSRSGLLLFCAALWLCAPACTRRNQPKEEAKAEVYLALARESCLECHHAHSRSPLVALMLDMSEQRRRRFLEQALTRNMPPDPVLRDLFALRLRELSSAAPAAAK